MLGGGFEELEHTADWALRVRGRDFRELLLNAAAGMLELAGVETAAGKGPERSFELAAPDPESLLVDWLHELLLALELRRVAFRHIQLELKGNWRLHARVQEVPVSGLAKPIKAVTYHDLRIDHTPEGLQATVVFDV